MKKDDLARSATALGRDMNFFGSKDRDFVIQTRGRVKINYGDKFTELFNGSKFTVGVDAHIKQVHGKPDASSPDGFFWDVDSGTLYFKVGDKCYPLFTEGEMADGFVSYMEEQGLTAEEQDRAKENIGAVFETREEAEANCGNGVVYVKEENKAYLMHDCQLFPITENTEIDTSDGDRYYFDKTVVIDVDEGDIALWVQGFDTYVRFGDEDNHTDVYQTENGFVVDASRSFDIQIGGKTMVHVEDGKIDFYGILEALEGIITDEIYSSNFEKGDPSLGEGRGWGLWVDPETGESYLQVDHIMTEDSNPPAFIRYQKALDLMKKGEVVPLKKYVVIDYQNEWEVTTVEEELGTGFAANGFDPVDDSLRPDAYEEGEKEPKWGIDRNVRPLLLTGKSRHSYDDTARYWYHEDSGALMEMRYDIRGQNYSVIEAHEEEEYFSIDDTWLDFPDKGRIYHARDCWNNEAPCDFKHFVTEDGRHVFNSPDGKDLSEQNTADSVVCSNNRILDVTIRLAEKISPMLLTGRLVNDNTVQGAFEDVEIGDAESVIEYNAFDGVVRHCRFTGNFSNNSIGCTMDTCSFHGGVTNNEFNKDMKGCSFYGDVEGNIFDMAMEGCSFAGLSGNSFTGSMKDCGNVKEGDSEAPEGLENIFRDNTLIGNFEGCKWLKNAQNNDVRTVSMKDCSFEGGFTGNDIDGDAWEGNTFGRLSSNRFTGTVRKCGMKEDGTEAAAEEEKEMRENTFTGDYEECKWLGNTWSNDMRVDSAKKCVFRKDMHSNSIEGSKWEEDEFQDSCHCNIFKADTVKLVAEGSFNNNQLLGKVEEVHFYKDETNKDYGINNNLLNGRITKWEVKVDFSHNTFTGPVENFTVELGEPYKMDHQGESEIATCQFNYNDIKAASTNELTVKGDFRRNTVKAQVFYQCEFEGPFECNTLSYDNIDNCKFKEMRFCKGSGNYLKQEFTTSFIDCTFYDMQSCQFKEEPIKHAIFRAYMGADGNFTDENAVKNLKLLYDDKHQTDVFVHNDKVTVSCQACLEPLKGEIRMFNGLVKDIPDGWHVCDGEEGTPDLRDRFIMASVDETGESTDENSMDYPVPLGIPEHTHLLKFVETNSKKRVQTSDDSGQKTYLAAVGSMFKDEEGWEPFTGGNLEGHSLVTGEKYDGQGLVSPPVPVADPDAPAEPPVEGEGPPTEEEGDKETITEIKLPRYYKLIFIMKL